jgi:AcrR family transcriptional regulator
MAETVKRHYSSQLRTAHARQTRRAVVRAAAELFATQGFGRTTIEEIAAAAGVSRKTVFASVGGKADILKLAIDWAIVGDDEPVALIRRPVIQEARKQTDPDLIIRTWASVVCQISKRLAGLAWALVSAAGTDPQSQQLLEAWHAQRLTGARSFVRHLTKHGGLRSGLSVSDAVDIVWVHNDPILFYRLVQQRGWSAKRYESWLYRTIRLQLHTETPDD